MGSCEKAAPAAGCRWMRAPVLAASAWLPDTWSAWRWVSTMWAMTSPLRRASATYSSTRSRAGSITAASPQSPHPIRYERQPASSLTSCWKIISTIVPQRRELVQDDDLARARALPAPRGFRWRPGGEDFLLSALDCLPARLGPFPEPPGLGCRWPHPRYRGSHVSMRIKVLGAFGSEGQGQRPSAFLVNDRTLVDAGSVGGALAVPEQVEIEQALLSHAHLDHVVGLAFLTDTLAITGARRPITAWSIEPVIDALRRHAFNDVLWPDFTAIPSPEQPFLRLATMAEDVETRIGELRVLPVVVDHAVIATGYVIHDGDTGFVYTGDTGPTRRIWELARALRGLKALIVETAFPNRLDALARASGHLTPEMLRREIDKMPPDVPIWIFHIKPQLFQETAEQLATIDPTRIHTLEQGKTYSI